MIRNIDSMPLPALTDTGAVRRAWQPPRLSALGDVCGLTESGSKNGNEQYSNWGMWTCPYDINPNMQYNMC